MKTKQQRNVTLTDKVIAKEKTCSTLCIDCQKPCKLYLDWLDKYRQPIR